MTPSLLFPAHFLWTHERLGSLSDRKNRGLTKTMTVWFKGTAMGTLYCSPYLKLNIFRSNPGGRPKRTFRFLKWRYFFQSISMSNFQTIPMRGDFSYHLPARWLAKNINSKSRKERFPFSIYWKLFIVLGDLRRISQDLTFAILRLLTWFIFFDFLVLDIRFFLSGVKKAPELMDWGS